MLDSLPSLPSGFALETVLSRSVRGDVLRVSREGQAYILRLSREASESDALVAQLSLLGGARGLALPIESGRTDDGVQWTLRPYLEGPPLDQALRSAGEERAVRWIAELLESLAALHERGLLHRDVKAENVIVTDDGPVLLDLDLIAVENSAAAGSPDHLAPELLMGHAHGAAADLFALGATLAYAWCGEPAANFRRDFPQRSFWDAAQLDAARVPEPLRALVRDLVRRHPQERTATARAALQRLDVETGVAPELEPGFDLGREGELLALRGEWRHPPRADRELVLLVLDDPEEMDELLQLVAVSLTLSSRPPRRPDFSGPLEAALAVELEQADDVLVDADDLSARHGPGAPVELARAFAEHRVRGDARWWVACTAETAEEIGAAADPNQPGVALRRLGWPSLDEPGLRKHLERLTDGASPALTEGLARTLHAQVGGSRHLLRTALREAESSGVLSRDGPRWAALIDTWPALSRPDQRIEELLAAEADPALRRTLACLATWDAPLRLGAASELGDVSPASLGSAIPGLLSRGLLDEATHARGGIAWRSGLAETVLSAFPLAERRAAHARVLERLPADADPLVTALHQLALAEDAEALGPLLATCAELISESRLAPARRLAQRIRIHEHAAAWTDAIRLLEARLELAQARSNDALQLLETGGLLDGGASAEALLVAAEACELLGQHERAGKLNRRLLNGEATPTERLHALAGLAFGRLVDGDALGVLEATEDAPTAKANHESRCKLLNVRGLALTDLGRYDEAAEAFDRAGDHARRSPSPLTRARVAMNKARLDRRQARFSEAVEALEIAAEAYTSAGHVRGRARALHLLGVLLGERGEAREARGHLLNALALRRRVGDAAGHASSLAALGVVQIEASEWGAAEETLAAARAAMERYGFERELQLLGIYESLVAGVCGRDDDSLDARAETESESDPADHPGLRERVGATLAWLRDDTEGAERSARQALALASKSGESAEVWRSANLVLAITPDDADVADALRRAGKAQGGRARASELAWRGDGPRDAASLETLLDDFERAGLRLQAHACALELRRAHENDGDDIGRRRASLRARNAADALTDGLPTERRADTLARLERLLPRSAVDTEDSPMQLNWLLSCNRRMATEDDLEGLLLSIIDMALEVSGARRGLLLLLSGEEVDVQVARAPRQRAMLPEEAEFSRTVVREAVRSEAPIVTVDATSDERFAGTASLAAIRSQAVLCVPLPGSELLSGAIYLDDEQRELPFDQTDIAKVSALADQAQVAILNLRHRAEIEQLNARLSERVRFQADELDRTRSALRKSGRVAPVGGLIGESEAMRTLYTLIERVAPTQLSALVTGPSGAGKDLVSRALHERSDRADGPLLIENVAAVPANLLESELFGHVRGAFTGADRDRKGLLAEADGGTFVLDEIGELPMDLQPKLLRALETGEVRPVGGRKPVKVDVRFIAATNRDLLERVRSGDFREDLYYRLNAIEVRVPPLEERPSDIPLLAQHFLDRLNAEHGTQKALDDSVLRALVQRNWPGQVRELSNEIGRLYYLSGDQLVDASLVRDAAAVESDGSTSGSLRLEDVEREAVQRALEAADGRKDRAAQLLGISRAGLYTKLKRLGIGSGAD